MLLLSSKALWQQQGVTGKSASAFGFVLLLCKALTPLKPLTGFELSGFIMLIFDNPPQMGLVSGLESHLCCFTVTYSLAGIVSVPEDLSARQGL